MGKNTKSFLKMSPSMTRTASRQWLGTSVRAPLRSTTRHRTAVSSRGGWHRRRSIGASERTSARDASGEPASRLDWAKHELEGAVRELPGDARFVVIPFSGRAARWNDRFVPATPQVRAALHAMLGGLGAQGGTNVWGALDAALNLSDARFGEVVDDGPDEIFVLSDGQPSAGEVQAPAAILAAIREANRYRRVRIHTVALGGGSAFLEQLARDHGGTYVAR